MALADIAAWAYHDAGFVHTASSLKTAIARFGKQGINYLFPPPNQGALGYGALVFLLLIGVISVITIAIALFIGPASHRRIRSWLGLMALIAGWLTLWTNWPEIAWLGQQRRLHAELAEFESIAFTHRSNWPTQDGEHPVLGPFMAYPVGRPTILLLLTPPESPRSGIKIAAIELHPNGGLCFQLAAAETGAWLEWHPPGKSPQSFTGGLLTEYRLERSTQIAPEWFLVRYTEPQVLRAPTN
jgi:hypothetical protein